MFKGTENIKKGIIIIFVANIINLCISLARNFILPKYLPIEIYADIKFYQLINSYGGLLALGYIDGIHIKYGGKNISQIDKVSFLKNLSTFRIIEVIIVLNIIIIGALMKNYILIFSALSILTINITGYYSSFFQAIGLFSYYTKILNTSSIMLFIINMVLIFLVKTKESYYYILGYVFVYFFIWVIVEIFFYNLSGIKPKYFQFSFKEAKDTICIGFFLMCGLLASNFMTGMDRWFVKVCLTTTHFAMYSFAVSTEGFLGYAISPISLTMYNYFCREKDIKNILKLKDCIILFSVLIIGSAFGVKIILENYLKKYYMANNVIFLLFASHLLYSIIKCLFINLYKAQKRQKEYFIKMVIVVIVGIFFNIIAYFICKKMEAFAIATLLSSVLWCICCCLDFKELKFGIKEFLYIGIVIIVFLYCGIRFNSMIGLILYYLIIMGLSLVFYRELLCYLTEKLKEYLKLRRRKC